MKEAAGLTMSRADIKALFNSGPLQAQPSTSTSSSCSTPVSFTKSPLSQASSTSSLYPLSHDDIERPPAKQRRVSLPASQLRYQFNGFRDEMGLPGGGLGGKGKERARTLGSSDVVGGSSHQRAASTSDEPVGKRARKRWTREETQMLIDGCNDHGVGNWTAILNDSKFSFQSRSAGDLKDRFRTYFPDEYRKHYPNAKTHISRSRPPPFSPLPSQLHQFERTKPVRRKTFSPEEDEALRKGYEVHGQHWARIAKDPILQDRRPTDLRDRFRHIFRDLYQVRRSIGSGPVGSKKKSSSEPPSPPLGPTSMGIHRGRRRSMVIPKSKSAGAVITSRRGGMSEGEEGAVGEDDASDMEGTEVEHDGDCDGTGQDADVEAMDLDGQMHTPNFAGPLGLDWLPPTGRPSTSAGFTSHDHLRSSTSSSMHDRPPSVTFPSSNTFDFSLPFVPSQPQPRPESLYSENTTADEASLSQWSASEDPSASAWATSASSPSELLFASAQSDGSPNGFPFPIFTSPRQKQPPAWGLTNWLHPNARLSGGDPPPLPSHDVVDRYNLYSTPGVMMHDFQSEAGALGGPNTWGVEERERRGENMAALFRGFTHHSTAGDLIRGSGVRAGGVVGMQLPAGWQPLLPDFGRMPRRVGGGAETEDGILEHGEGDEHERQEEGQEDIEEVDLQEPAFGIGLEELERAALALRAEESAAAAVEAANGTERQTGVAPFDLQLPASAASASRMEDATTPTLGATNSGPSQRPPSPLSLTQTFGPTLLASLTSTPTTLMRELVLDAPDYPIHARQNIDDPISKVRAEALYKVGPPTLRRSNSLFDQIISLRGPSLSPSPSLPSLDLATPGWEMRSHSLTDLPPLFGEVTFDTDALDLAEVLSSPRRSSRDVNRHVSPLEAAEQAGAKKRKRVSWGGT